MYYVLCIRASLIAKLVKSPPAMQETLGREDMLEKGIGYPLQYSCGSAGKQSACNAGDLGLIPGLGRSPGEGRDYPLQYSGLENSMDCVVRDSDTTEQLSHLHTHLHSMY